MIQCETIFQNLEALNKYSKVINKKMIFCVNIRSTIANDIKLQVVVEILVIKLFIIVCPEAWEMDHYKYFSLRGYRLCHNDDKMNEDDGVVFFLNHSTEGIEFENPVSFAKPYR